MNNGPPSNLNLNTNTNTNPATNPSHSAIPVPVPGSVTHSKMDPNLNVNPTTNTSDYMPSVADSNPNSPSKAVHFKPPSSNSFAQPRHKATTQQGSKHIINVNDGPYGQIIHDPGNKAPSPIGLETISGCGPDQHLDQMSIPAGTRQQTRIYHQDRHILILHPQQHGQPQGPAPGPGHNNINAFNNTKSSYSSSS